MYKRRLLTIILSVAVLTGMVAAVTSDKVVAKQDTSENDVKIYYKVPMENEDGMIHYCLEDKNGQELSLVEGVNTAGRNKRAVVLPEKYDPRGTEKETPIRNQEDTGACWAFGALKALETDCINKGLLTVDNADLSENHLAWYAYHRMNEKDNPLYGDYFAKEYFSDSESYDMGGNAVTSQFILANRWGAAWESSAPFSNKKTMARQMKRADSSLRYESVIQLTHSECYDPKPDDPFNIDDRNEIKQAILEHGAVDVALYYDTSIMVDEDGFCSGYTDEHTGSDANHCVTIVGWDDSINHYVKDAPAPGAWLIANSYGTERNDKGYYWVSYYDTSLTEFYTFEGVCGDTYETAFQYDGFGWDNAYSSEQEIQIANIFTSDSIQRLEAVSFYTLAKNQPYTVDVYRNLQGSYPKSGEWVSSCSVSGTLKHAGYHTVPLAEPIAVAAGEKFSVVVTYNPVEGMTYVPTEGDDVLEYGVYYNSNKGQSYTYFAEDETWYDNTAVEVEGKTCNMNNVCVKVFGNPATEEEYIEQQKNYIPQTPKPDPTKVPSAEPTPTTPVATVSSASVENTATPEISRKTDNSTDSSGPVKQVQISCKSKYTIGKGERFTLPLKNSLADGKRIFTFRSSKPKIVKVDKNGKVTGKKKGTAKITIRTTSGTKKTITVVVKSAPKRIKITIGKNKLKKRKTTKLKVSLNKGSASYKIKYRSSNKKIAFVSSKGKVTAKKQGTIRIYAETFNHKKAYIKIRVL